MQFEALNPIGARITGLRVGALDCAEVEQVRHLLAEHGVVVIGDQDVTDDEFLSFLKSFGPMTFTVGETPVPDHPDLNVVSNVGRSTPPRSTFHVDTSYVRHPPAYTALRAVTVPRFGGHTLFTNQYRAYETLPAPMLEMIRGRTITHVVTGLELGDDEETSAVHPIVARHPVTGRESLYLSTPKRCAEVSGMSPGHAADTVAYLFEHCTAEDNVYRHGWSPGDVVMWDNRCVMHCADHTGVIGDRVMHRGMVASV